MNRRGFLKSIAVLAASTAVIPTLAAPAAAAAPKFEYVYPFIEVNRCLRINPAYVQAKYRCWLFKQGDQYFYQIRHIDDPPKGRVRTAMSSGKCGDPVYYVDDHWPAKFNYIGDLPAPRKVETRIDQKPVSK